MPDGRTEVELAPWRCECGHVIGYVRRVGRVRTLMVHDHLAEIDPPTIIARICGHAEVICRKCGKWREWHGGPEGLDRLLRRREALKSLARGS